MCSVDISIKEKDPTGADGERLVVVSVSSEAQNTAVDYAIVLASTLMSVGLEASVGKVRS